MYERNIQIKDICYYSRLENGKGTGIVNLKGINTIVEGIPFGDDLLLTSSTICDKYNTTEIKNRFHVSLMDTLKECKR